MPSDVSVVTYVFGHYQSFLGGWMQSVQRLEPAEIIVATDQEINVPGARVVVASCGSDWKHVPAFYRNLAVREASSEWVWPLDVDDLAFPDALDGIDRVHADVWQMGFEQGGVTHLPRMPKDPEENTFCGASAMRAEIFRWVRGYPDIAFEDWGLWRRILNAGGTFQFSDRAHFLYFQHQDQRTRVEFNRGDRTAMMKQLAECDF